MVATALGHTGCSKTILNQNFLPKNLRKCLNSPKVVTFEGKGHQFIGSAIVTHKFDSIKVPDEVILVNFRKFGIDVMLGMNTIKLQGEVYISSTAKFGFSYCGKVVLNNDKVNKIEIKKKDHEAVFKGVEWRVKCKFRDGEGPTSCLTELRST